MEPSQNILEDGSSVSQIELSQTSDQACESTDYTKSHHPSSPPYASASSPSPLDGSDQTLEQSLATLSISNSSSESMFRALSSIFQASQVHEGGIILNQPNSGDIWTILHRANEGEIRGERNAAALRSVRGVLDQMSWAQSQLLLPAVRTMADASREASWRLPFGEGGILNFALALVASNNTSTELQIQSLRLIGNSCADTDENRHRVVSNHYLQMIIARIENPKLTSVAIPVVYNICCDYEAAQQQALKVGIFATLIRGLETAALTSPPALSYACRLFDMGIDGLDLSHSPDNSVELLLRAAIHPDLDVDDCASLVDCAVAHLRAERFQMYMATHDLLGVPLKLLIRTYFPEADLTGTRIPPIGSMATVLRDPNEEAEMIRLRKAIISSFSEVSALDDFSVQHSSLNTWLIDLLVKWLSVALPQLQLCACIILGNLAQSDEICNRMVSRLHLHKDLILILRSATDTQVVHSILGFLRNLALPQLNKQQIGEAGVIEALTRFLSPDSLPQVSHAAAALARQLVIGNFSNVRRILTPLSTDEESPASARTYLSLLLSLFEKTDELGVKTEVARIVASILRTIHSSTPADTSSKDDFLHRLYSLHPNVGAPLGMMVSQSKYPVIRSEGWFAMALMARSPAGATLINKTISEIKVFTALEETIRGTSTDSNSALAPETSALGHTSPSSPNQSTQPQEMKMKDRENAMILVNELLQNRDEDQTGSESDEHPMADIRRSALEDLLQVGSQVERRQSR